MQFQDVNDLILKDMVAKGKEAKLASFEQVCLFFTRVMFHRVSSSLQRDILCFGNVYAGTFKPQSLSLLCISNKKALHVSLHSTIEN